MRERIQQSLCVDTVTNTHTYTHTDYTQEKSRHTQKHIPVGSLEAKCGHITFIIHYSLLFTQQIPVIPNRPPPLKVHPLEPK